MAADFFSMVQKVGIFIILSQTLLHFRPNEEYEKYIKILCNIIILTMFIVPVLALFEKDIGNEFEAQVIQYQKQMEQMELPIEQKMEDSGVELNAKIEEEIKSRLNKIELENYKITHVTLRGMDENRVYNADELHITIELKEVNGTKDGIKVDKIHVGEESETIEENGSTRKYKEEFAEILGMNEAYVEVVIRG